MPRLWSPAGSAMRSRSPVSRRRSSPTSWEPRRHGCRPTPRARCARRPRSSSAQSRWSPTWGRGLRMVGGTRFELMTSSVSRKRATNCANRPRWRRDLNPCRRICSPLPRLSANPPGKSSPVVSGVVDLRADDEIRTRDPHLGKVMLYQLSHVRMPQTRHGRFRRVENHSPHPTVTQNPIGVTHAPCRRDKPGRGGSQPRGRPRCAPPPRHALGFQRSGRLAQLVARFVHTEEVISSSLVSPTTSWHTLTCPRPSSATIPPDGVVSLAMAL